MPTVQDLSDHWSVSSRTIRQYAGEGLKHHRVNREYRFDWQDIWSLEEGPRPPTALHERYTAPLATKRTLATALQISVRTVDRFIERGLPTRNVRGNVRFQIHDAAAWLERHAGVDSHILTRNLLALHGRPHTQRRFDYGDARATGADLPLLSREQSANSSPRGPAAPRGRGRRARRGDAP